MGLSKNQKQIKKCQETYFKLGEIKGRRESFKEVQDYISERGFRDSNYETNEIIRWLWAKIKNKPFDKNAGARIWRDEKAKDKKGL